MIRKALAFVVNVFNFLVPANQGPQPTPPNYFGPCP